MTKSELPVRVTVRLHPYDRWGGIDPLTHAVARADDLGYYGVSFPEHVIWPVTGGPDPLAVVWYDNFVLGATLAAATTRIKLIFNVCVIPYRHPLELAKLVATLDQASKGRVVLVAGTGWMKREFAALGIPFEERGARTDDSLRAMKVLWTEDQPSYEGEFFTIPPVHFFPKCAQSPHVPIWIGGNGPRPFRRAVEMGDGWSAFGGTLDDVIPMVATIKDGLAAAGRDADAFTFSTMLPFGPPDPVARAAQSRHGASVPEPEVMTAERTLEYLGRAREAGINHFLLEHTWRDPGHYEDTIEEFARDVMAKLG